MASMAIPADPATMGGAGTQSPVLRVIVENLFYPVTLDVLHQVQNGFVICLSHSATYYELVSPFPIFWVHFELLFSVHIKVTLTQ